MYLPNVTSFDRIRCNKSFHRFWDNVIFTKWTKKKKTKSKHKKFSLKNYNFSTSSLMTFSPVDVGKSILQNVSKQTTLTVWLWFRQTVGMMGIFHDVVLQCFLLYTKRQQSLRTTRQLPQRLETTFEFFSQCVRNRRPTGQSCGVKPLRANSWASPKSMWKNSAPEIRFVERVF